MAKFVETPLSAFVRGIVEGQVRSFLAAHPDGEARPGHFVSGIGKRITHELCAPTTVDRLLVLASELALASVKAGSGSDAGRKGEAGEVLAPASPTPEAEHCGRNGDDVEHLPASGPGTAVPLPSLVDAEVIIRGWSDMEVCRALVVDSALNRARRVFSGRSGGIEQQSAQGQSPVETRRQEFLAVIEIIRAWKGWL